MEAVLNDVVYPTMQARGQFVAAVLHNTTTGERITNSVHAQDIEALLASHPEAQEKIGPGIDFISVEEHPGFRSKCFCVNRVDGTRAFFSYRKCLKGKPKTDSLRARFNSAARLAVARELQIAKYNLIEQNGGRSRCEITGKELPPERLSVDHMWPYGFSLIVDLFLKQERLILHDGLFKTSTADQLEFSDLELAERFRDHHRVCSEGFLRLVAKTTNVTDAARHKLVRAKVPLVLTPSETGSPTINAAN